MTTDIRRIVICIMVSTAMALAGCSQSGVVTREKLDNMFFIPLAELPGGAVPSSRLKPGERDSLVSAIETLDSLLGQERRQTVELSDEVARLRQVLTDMTTFRLEETPTVILEGVTFRSNSTELTGISESILQKAVIALQLDPDIRVEVVGYTDDVGNAEYNTTLSLNRAIAVKQWLVDRGIPEERLVTMGMGPAEPIAPNDTEAGRSQNRRIEFHVIKDE